MRSDDSRHGSARGEEIIRYHDVQSEVSILVVFQDAQRNQVIRWHKSRLWGP